MAPTGFLDLPAELRLQIYEEAITSSTEPVKDHLGGYKGLILSCKVVHQEIQHEIVENMKKYLATMKEVWDEDEQHFSPLHITTPTTIADVLHKITVSIPNSWIRFRCRRAPGTRPAYGGMGCLPSCFTKLTPLPLSRLTITTHEDGPVKEHESMPLEDIPDDFPIVLFNKIQQLIEPKTMPIILTDYNWCEKRLSCDALTLKSDLEVVSVEGQRYRLITSRSVWAGGYTIEYLAADGTVYERKYWVNHSNTGMFEIERVLNEEGILVGMTHHRLAERPRPPLDEKKIEDRREPRYVRDSPGHC